MAEEISLNSKDSLLGLLFEDSPTTTVHTSPLRPPSAPRPPQRAVKPRRASSIVRSPYLVAAPRPLSQQTTPPPPPLSSSTVTSRNSSGQRNIFVSIKRRRTASAKVTKNDHSEDFSGKTALDLRDELTATKRTFAATEGERDWMRGEILKLKQLLDKKDKEIEDLIMGGHVSSRDRARINTGNKTDFLLAMSSYKHRIHALERSLRDKDTLIASLRADIKTTRLKELEIEKETFITEILRLRGVVEHVMTELNNEVPQSRKNLSTKLVEAERQVLELKTRCRGLFSERETLLKRLGFWKEDDKLYPEDDERASKYLSLSQGAAIIALVQLELTIEDKLQVIANCEETRSQLIQTHQSEMEALNKEVEERDVKIKQLEITEENYVSLQDEHSSLKSELTETHESLKEERLKMEETLLITNSLKEEAAAERTAREFAQQLNKKRNHRLLLLDKGERVQSAVVIQRQWRLYRSKKRQQQFEMEHNEMITTLQCTIKGHLIRQQYINTCNTIALASSVQSVLSGHSARKHFVSSSMKE